VPMLEGNIDHVIGVDTHREHHAAAILDRNGGLVAQLEVPSSQAGYAQLLGFVVQRVPGPALLGAGGHRLLRRRAGERSGRPGRVGDRDRPAQAAPGPQRR
jgi:hypothetical protein